MFKDQRAVSFVQMGHKVKGGLMRELEGCVSREADSQVEISKQVVHEGCLQDQHVRKMRGGEEDCAEAEAEL